MDRQTNKYDWDRLTKLQLGKYAEYFVKMEFTLHRFDVYTSEVDERGVDFVIRTKGGRYYDVQVKSFRVQERKSNYIFVQKEKFRIDPTMLLGPRAVLRWQTPRTVSDPRCDRGAAEPSFGEPRLWRGEKEQTGMGYHAVPEEARVVE